MPVAFYSGILCLLITFFMMFDRIPFSTAEEVRQERDKMIMASTSMGLWFLFQFFLLLYSAADINEEFVVHREILKQNKDLLQDILMFKEYYFADKLIPDIVKN